MSNKILKESVINFFFKKEECKSLSNFWVCDIVLVDGDETRVYESGESCYHGEKFIRVAKFCKDENRKKDLINYGKKIIKGVLLTQEGSVIKKMGKGFILSNDELLLWAKLTLDVQIAICNYKFDTYKEVRNDLLNSKGKILVHPAMRCSIDNVRNREWEGRAIVVDGKVEIVGGNMLGKLWMKLRDEKL